MKFFTLMEWVLISNALTRQIHRLRAEKGYTKTHEKLREKVRQQYIKTHEKLREKVRQQYTSASKRKVRA